jgi:hypothetical protein
MTRRLPNGRWPVPRADGGRRCCAAGAKPLASTCCSSSRKARGRCRRARQRGDAALAQAIAGAGNVVLPFTFKFGGRPDGAAKPYLTRAAYARLHKSPAYRPLPLEPTGALTPFATLAEAAILGHMLVAYDVDGAPRYEYPVIEYDLDYYPSMAVRIAQLFLGVPWKEVGVDLGLGISIGPVHVPTDPQMRLLVNYLGPAHTFATYPLSQVLSGAVPASIFRDRVVLVGADALGTRDTFASPFTA